jgi:hypothetical protein
LTDAAFLLGAGALGSMIDSLKKSFSSKRYDEDRRRAEDAAGGFVCAGREVCQWL